METRKETKRKMVHQGSGKDEKRRRMHPGQNREGSTDKEMMRDLFIETERICGGYLRSFTIYS